MLISNYNSNYRYYCMNMCSIGKYELLKVGHFLTHCEDVLSFSCDLSLEYIWQQQHRRGFVPDSYPSSLYCVRSWEGNLEGVVSVRPWTVQGQPVTYSCDFHLKNLFKSWMLWLSTCLWVGWKFMVIQFFIHWSVLN